MKLNKLYGNLVTQFIKIREINNLILNYWQIN